MAAANGKPLLRVENLKTHFHTRDGIVRAVDGVSFEVNAGETLAIVGESGCGKSVTSMSILRLLPMPPARIAEGRIEFDGRNLLELSEPEMRKVRGNAISMIFQEPMTSLNPVLTVGRQIAETLVLHRGLTQAEAMARAVDALAKVRISEPERRVKQYPHELSGGMRQRVALARALALQPEVLLMDEPFAALDAQTRDHLHAELQELWQASGTTIVFVTHNVREAVLLGDRVVVMTGHPGRIRAVTHVRLPRPRSLEDHRITDLSRLVGQYLRDTEDVA